MCGIFGSINLSGSYTERDYRSFISATNLVSYRGPEYGGYKTFNLSEGNGENSFSIFLGHRRLSIIDLSDNGRQPMSVDGLCIVFNGEIFNYIELKNDLISLGEIFVTDTDTEVILKIYKRFGEKGFTRLNGMWAFVIYDSINELIIISRDRFSIKPLYYLNNDNEFYFASEIKQLLPFVPRKEVNEQNLYSFLQQGLVEFNNQTFFKDIQKIPAKQNLIIDLRKKKLYFSQYWNYTINPINNEKEGIELFYDLFKESVKIRLRSDVNVGSLLSGGLDSSAISILAAEMLKESFSSYSVVSNDRKYSEEKFIDIMGKQKYINNKKLIFEPELVLNKLDEVMYHQEEPFGSLSIMAQYLIFEKIKKETDITVVLSGQGGDEILMGYLKYFFFYLKDLTKKGKLIDVFKQIFYSIIQRTVISQFEIKTAKRYIPFLADRQQKHLRLKQQMIDTWSFDNLTERQIKDIDFFSVPGLAHFEDRNSMAHSLEVRNPFLDHRLVNAALSLTPTIKIKNGWTKYALRKAMSELPDQIRWRRDKKGFTTPDNNWLKSELKPLIQNSFSKSILGEMGYIDSKLFLGYYDSFLNGAPIYDKDIFRILCAELWMKKWIAN
jgi:asparagine synthase (glutamine-hydrolysing)